MDKIVMQGFNLSRRFSKICLNGASHQRVGMRGSMDGGLRRFSTDENKLFKYLESIIKSELQSVKSDMKSELQSVKSDMKSDMKSEMQSVKSDMKSEIESVKADMKSEMQSVKSEIESMAALYSQLSSMMPIQTIPEDFSLSKKAMDAASKFLDDLWEVEKKNREKKNREKIVDEEMEKEKYIAELFVFEAKEESQLQSHYHELFKSTEFTNRLGESSDTHRYSPVQLKTDYTFFAKGCGRDIAKIQTLLEFKLIKRDSAFDSKDVKQIKHYLKGYLSIHPREYIDGILMDGQKIQFFRNYGNDYVKASSPQDLVTPGVTRRIIATLLEDVSPPLSASVIIDNKSYPVRYGNRLGEGANCLVWEGIIEGFGDKNKIYAAKVYRKNKELIMEREIKVLKAIQEVESLRGAAIVKLDYECEGGRVILMSPVGERFKMYSKPFVANSNALSLEDFRSLITTLQKLHQAGIIHSDVKPGNLFRNNNRLYLNDFSSASMMIDATSIQAHSTPFYLPTHHLELLQAASKENKHDRLPIEEICNIVNVRLVPSNQGDLESAVKTAYSLIYGERRLKYVDEIIKHWANVPNNWLELLKLARDCKYSELITAYGNMRKG